MRFFNHSKSNRFVFLLAVSAVSLSFSACSMYAPSRVSQNKIQVEEERIVQEVPTEDLTPVAVRALASHYQQHGDGPLSLTVTYDPKSKDMTAMKASNRVAELTQTLKDEGVSSVEARVLPVKDSESSQAIISYVAYNALAPKDCSLMPGIEGRTMVEADPDYKLGCSVDTLFARQIAHPKDLKGQSTDDMTDGRRLANQVEVYRTGQPNQPLNGETSTGE